MKQKQKQINKNTKTKIQKYIKYKTNKTKEQGTTLNERKYKH